jgi:hypothetical protein
MPEYSKQIIYAWKRIKNSANKNTGKKIAEELGDKYTKVDNLVNGLDEASDIFEELATVGGIRYGKNFTTKLSSNTSLNTIERSIAEESHQILNSSEFKKITDGFANKTPVQIEINGRTISYDDAPFSGMTWFEKNGFNLGREAFVSEEELIKTVLHEMHRLKTSTLRGTGSAAQVSQETKAAFDFANIIFNLFE